MKKWLFLIIGLALLLRAFNLLHGFSFHPDERHMVMVTMRLGLDNLNPESFAYGSLPFYLLWLLSSALSVFSRHFVSYDGLFLVGRSIAVVFGLLGIWLTYLTGKALVNRQAGILAAALLAFNVFHLQLSRFFTVDIILTAFGMAAMLFFLKLSESNKLRHYAGGGLFFGLSFATKLSGASLLIPFAVAVGLRLMSEGRWFSSRIFLGVTAFALSALAAVIVFQPYMFLDWATYYAHNRDQLNMVRGAWRPPYTIQYENTLPFLYHLEQMFFYTMGPPLALAALTGILLFAAKQIGTLRKKDLIVLSWVVVYFISVASYQVKFPRYLLPLYPFLFIFAAYGLSQAIESLKPVKKAFLGHAVAALVVCWTVFYGFAFTTIYSKDHVYRIASQWVFENIEPGAKLLGVHWDDKLPIHLPGLDPKRYEMFGSEWDLKLYEHENEERVRELARQLEVGDYIIFPTARTYGSLLRVPDEYPLTNNLIGLLFRGSLGYELIQSFKVRPSLFGIEFTNDLADESLTVYDHPKVLVFKNKDEHAKEEILNRIYNPSPFSPLPDREWIMKRDAGDPLAVPPAAGKITLPETSALVFFQILVWLFCLALFAFTGFSLLSTFLDKNPETAFSLSIPLGFLAFGYTGWLLGSLQLMAVNANTLWLLLIGLIALSLWCVFRYGFRLKLRESVLPLSLFGLSFSIFLVLRAFNPEIYWGEKPMNFSFLNYFIRLDYLPPDDPWAAGQRMNYYYMGSFLFALLHKLSGIDPGIGYNLSIATLAGFFTAAAYALLLSLSGRRLWAAVGAIGMLFLSNLEVVHLTLFSDRQANFDLFWAGTRLFTSPAITEYPLWSFLFADLHAHVIALPFVVLALALTPAFFEKNALEVSAANVGHRFVFSLAMAAVFTINSWDAISLTVVGLIAFCVLLVRKDELSPARRLKLIVLNGLFISGVSLTLAAPFLLQSHSAAAIGYGFVLEDFDRIEHLIRHFGHWLLIVFGAAFFSREAFNRPLLSRLIVALTLASLPYLLAVVSYLFNQPADFPWVFLVLPSLLIFSAGFFLCCHRSSDLKSISAVFVLSAGFIIAFTQIFFLMDRMNTIFKFYNAVWLLLSISSFALLTTVLRRYIFLFPVVIVLAVSLLGSLINIAIMTFTYERISGPRPTLNGMAYLDRAAPYEASLISWINDNIDGTPVILEAQGISYGPYTRITMHTGLPTVLGWEHHVYQRGTPRSEIAKRRDDIKTIYSTPDSEEALSLLRNYSVSYVVVAGLERNDYPEEGLQKFKSDYFEVLFSEGEATLYRVR